MKIIKIAGRHRNTNRVKSHEAVITVEKDGVVRDMLIPVYSGYSTIVTLARRWKNTPGNLDRLEQAFDRGDDFVPSNRIK